ncbi:MAG: bifunctional DNA primase/polymerase [Bacteroidales bacterium]|nr:bifunctional DNA primase/polymerase [Bacteroidales bacterium]
MIEIPEQLKEARFVLVRPSKKNAFQSGWDKYANYAYDDADLINHLARGGNYGVLSWNGVCQFDIDNNDVFKSTGIKLPLSLIIKRGDHGHYYFTCSDCPKEARNKYVLTFGDVRLGGNFYVVGPNCIHPSGDKYEILHNEPIVDLPYEQILDIIDKYEICKEDTNLGGVDKSKYPPMGDWSDIIGLNCMNILPPAGKNVITTSTEVKGDHPIHGSTNGYNFHINPQSNTWFCHRHHTGGNAVMLYAMKKGILQCEDCKPGCLRGKGEQILLELKKDGYDITKIGVFGKIVDSVVNTREMLKAMGVL